MEAIGRILAYVLLAAAFTKNVLATSAGNVKFSRDSYKIARCNATKLELVPGTAPLNDIGDLWDILVNAFESEPNQGVEHNFISTFINRNDRKKEVMELDKLYFAAEL